ncbi:MAG TPA: competence/damage-inducible protein A [Microthrixaceae bacterium]|nr:competence/damage-inducible protein A [Microthrixaceae bacterium]
MRCEVVAIGTELLLGQIVDTNSSWIGEQLALVGIDSHFQTKVGDNVDRIAATIELALRRSDAVICCGGLGPTQDDLTRQGIAQVMGVPLVFDEDRADLIRWMFRGRDRNMPDNNLLQAHRPEGAEFLETQPGTAPGLVCPFGDQIIYAVPGVPWEMKEMMAKEILPDLARRAGISSVIASRTLRTWGQSESGLAEMLAERIDELDSVGNPTLAFLASGIEGLKVRITAKADSDDEAVAVLDAEEAMLRKIIGQFVFGIDDQTMESVVLDALRDRGWTLAVAESVTGGLVGSRLASVPGASDVFVGDVVAYDSRVKFDLLDVPEGPVVTEEAARAMALGVRKLLGADVGIATTGVAGPAEQEGRPVGTVCLGVAVGDDDVHSIEIRLPGGRDQVREFSVITLLSLVRSVLVDRDG